MNQIIHADCIEWMQQQQPSCVNLTFGSPPYEAQRTYNIGFNKRGQEWVDWMVEVTRQSLRITDGLVAFVVEGFTKNFRWSATPALLMADLHRAGIKLRKPPAFARFGIPGSGGPDWLRNDYEFIVCATNGGKLPWSDNKAMGNACKYRKGGDMTYRAKSGKRVSYGYKEPKIANPGNIIKCVVGGGKMGSNLAHDNEAPFPEDLAEFFIRSFCPPGGIVYDPFGGSGTVPSVAIKTGRQFVATDVRECQVELMNRRLAEARQSLEVA